MSISRSVDGDGATNRPCITSWTNPSTGSQVALAKRGRRGDLVLHRPDRKVKGECRDSEVQRGDDA